MLNGLKNSRVVIARSGKMGYVQLFLDTLQRDLDQAVNNLSDRNPSLTDLIQVYQSQIQIVRKLLLQQMSFLSQQLSFDENKTPGIYERMESLEAERLKRIDGMNGLLTRQYIYYEGLLDKWYKSYFSDAKFREEALSRLFWTTNKDGQISLGLRSWSDHLLGFDSMSMELFINEFMRLAGYTGRELIKNETLASVLDETVFKGDAFAQAVESLYEGSSPLLVYKSQYANNLKWIMLLGTNSTVKRSEELSAVLRKKLPGSSMLQSINITDPFTLFVAQVIDVIPVNAIQSMEYAEQVYQTRYGFISGKQAEKQHEQTSIFSAEKNALTFEQRLQHEIKQTSRLLRPIIVSALDQDNLQPVVSSDGRQANLARLYALALAAGWVRQIGQGAQSGQKIKIVFSAHEILVAEIPRGLALPVSPLVFGFVMFSARANEQDAILLQKAIVDASDETIVAWRQWTVNDWQGKDIPSRLINSGAEGNDLASITAIMVRDELRERMANS
jgi:hypothetical protein